jgi:hypothetical protein
MAAKSQIKKSRLMEKPYKTAGKQLIDYRKLNIFGRKQLK